MSNPHQGDVDSNSEGPSTVSWKAPDIRLAGLRRFAVAITILNVLGHAFFGFEQSIAHPLVGVLTAYFVEFLLEFIDAKIHRRSARYKGNWVSVIDFFLSAHITGLACTMLLYANERLLPVVFAAAVAIASKTVFCVTVGGRSRHFLNPSNFGISLTLLLFPWVGIAPPYHFSENLTGMGDWILPGVIVASGTFLNARFTKRMPLLAAWLAGFAVQAVLRSWIFGTAVMSSLLPMSGVAFILYTFYMITDPATSPATTRGQITFGLCVAGAYGFLLAIHIVFGLFFALTIVTMGRGLVLRVHHQLKIRAQAATESLPSRVDYETSGARGP